MIEFLVVIAVIALLIAILITALNWQGNNQKKITCSINLKQLDISFNLYGSKNDIRLLLNEMQVRVSPPTIGGNIGKQLQ